MGGKLDRDLALDEEDSRLGERVSGGLDILRSRRCPAPGTMIEAYSPSAPVKTGLIPVASCASTVR